jgi:hypothetical protein
MRDPIGGLADWNASPTHPCSCNGIVCDGAVAGTDICRVVALSLPRKGLVAALFRTLLLRKVQNGDRVPSFA